MLEREKLTDLRPQAITEKVKAQKDKVVAAVVGDDEADRGEADHDGDDRGPREGGEV